MARHTLVHSGEKAFTCTECEYSTNRKDSLVRHIRGKHVQYDVNT